MGWFKRSLPQDLRPREYGTADHFVLPSAVELDSPAYPVLHGIEGGVSPIVGNSAELIQDTAPEYAGRYELGFLNQPGQVTSLASLVPAPGSSDLAAPRDAGGVAGTNRIIHSVGPVDGTSSDGWTGSRADLHTPAPGTSGPVAGGPDYGQSLTAAYYSAAQANFSQAQAEAAMVAAL